MASINRRRRGLDGTGTADLESQEVQGFAKTRGMSSFFYSKTSEDTSTTATGSSFEKMQTKFAEPKVLAGNEKPSFVGEEGELPKTEIAQNTQGNKYY